MKWAVGNNILVMSVGRAGGIKTVMNIDDDKGHQAAAAAQIYSEKNAIKARIGNKSKPQARVERFI